MTSHHPLRGNIARRSGGGKKGRSASGKIEELGGERGGGRGQGREEAEGRKMETLDFSCSSRKREEVDGKALARDKTILS